MQEKHKQDVMNETEPWKVIAKKEEQRMDKEITDLKFLEEKQKPFIIDKQAEFEIVDAQYHEVHEKQESFQQEKNEKLHTLEFPRIHARVLTSSYSMQE